MSAEARKLRSDPSAPVRGLYVNRFAAQSTKKMRHLIDIADSTEIRDVVEVEVWVDGSITLTLLFDPEHNLEERILKEQFVP